MHFSTSSPAVSRCYPPVKVVENHRQVVQPAFDLQRVIRQRVLGVRAWEKKTKLRAKLFSSYDQVGAHGVTREYWQRRTRWQEVVVARVWICAFLVLRRYRGPKPHRKKYEG